MNSNKIVKYLSLIGIILILIGICSIVCQSQPAKDGGACSLLYKDASNKAMKLAGESDDKTSQGLLQESADFEEASNLASSDDYANSEFCKSERLKRLKDTIEILKLKLDYNENLPVQSTVKTAVKNVDRWLQ
jgi:hypothetical protein